MKRQWTLRRQLKELDAVHQVQLGLTLGLEAGWLYAWSAVLGGALDHADPAPLVGLPALAALLMTATLATRLAGRQAERVGRAQLGVSLLGLIVALLLATTGLKIEGWTGDWSTLLVLVRSNGLRTIETVGLVLLAWWRGIIAGRARPSLDSAEDGLRLASGALGLLFLLQVFAPRETQVVASLNGAVLLVITTGLIGLPLAAVQDQRERSRYVGSAGPSISGPWLVLLLGGVGALLLTALLLVQWLTFERLDVLLAPLGQYLGSLASSAIYLLALPIGYLIAALLWLLRLVIRPGEPPRLPDLSWLEELRTQAERPDQAASPFLPALSLLAGALLVVAVVWLLARAARRLAEWRFGDEVEEIHDFVWSWGTPGAGLLGRLRALLQRPTALAAVAPHDLIVDSPASHIRALYRRLLLLGARRGRQRPPDQTPDEYEQSLVAAGLFSSRQGELRLLTELYTRVRYGAEQPIPSTLAAARSALQQLETLQDPATSAIDQQSPADVASDSVSGPPRQETANQ